MRLKFFKGMTDALPIAFGYLSVSFGFGIFAVKSGLSVLEAVGISLTNLTSAGQAAGVGIIVAGGTLTEMILTQIVINLRYSLMAVSLTQKLDSSFNTLQRMIVAFGITDEIYAVASSQKERLNTGYMKGLILTPLIGWTAGTLFGAAAGQVLPTSVSNALGLMLYGMFIAIIIPPCKKNNRLIWTILMAAACSVVFTYCFPEISGGFSVIICAVLSAVLSALFFPIKEDDE